MSKALSLYEVLLIDDDKDLTETMGVLFETLGFNVSIAYNGKMGIDRIKLSPPNIIILDVMMPVMDGFQVCHYLKYESKFKDIPIIMLTALEQQQDIDRGLDVGADAYISKPFDRKDLLNKVVALLKIDKSSLQGEIKTLIG